MVTYNGHIRTQIDAILLFEACRHGILPRIQRRLTERERLQIKSGSIYVWDESEASMRRWTDGKSWSASRVCGSFLTYREMEGARKSHPHESSNNNSRKRKSAEPHGSKASSGGSSKEDEQNNNSQSDDDGTSEEGFRYKPGGLYKQSFSITTSDKAKLHLIAYYTREDVNADKLMQPSMDPRLKDIRIENELYPDNSSAASMISPVTTAPYQRPHAQNLPPLNPSNESLFSSRYPPHGYPPSYPYGYLPPPPPPLPSHPNSSASSHPQHAGYPPNYYYSENSSDSRHKMLPYHSSSSPSYGTLPPLYNHYPSRYSLPEPERNSPTSINSLANNENTVKLPPISHHLRTISTSSSSSSSSENTSKLDGENSYGKDFNTAGGLPTPPPSTPGMNYNKPISNTSSSLSTLSSYPNVLSTSNKSEQDHKSSPEAATEKESKPYEEMPNKRPRIMEAKSDSLPEPKSLTNNEKNLSPLQRLSSLAATAASVSSNRLYSGGYKFPPLEEDRKALGKLDKTFI